MDMISGLRYAAKKKAEEEAAQAEAEAKAKAESAAGTTNPPASDKPTE